MGTVSTAIRLEDQMSATIDAITSRMDQMLSIMANIDRTTDAMGQTIIENFEDSNNKNRTLNNTLKETDGLFGKLKNSALGLTGGFFSLRAAFGAIKQGIEYASDLNEVQNVVGVTFGDSEERINSFAKTALNAYGLNEVSAKRYAGTIGAMLSSSGIEGEPLVQMSEAITALSGDMASFYNLNPEEAFGKLRAGLSGETEPLKQLGINMSVANLEAYAMAEGITKSYQEMSQAEQVALRYNYILDAANNSQTDFSRTSGSFANQTKLLQENWTQFLGTIANSAIPTLERALQKVNTMLTNFTNNWDRIAPVLNIAARAMALVVAGLAAWKIATIAQTIAQQGLNAAFWACPVTWILAALAAIIGAVYLVVGIINKVTDSTISATGIIMGAISTAVAFLWNLLSGVVDLFVGVFANAWDIVAAFVNFFANVFNDPVGAIINLFWSLTDNILGAVQTAASFIDKILGTDMSGSLQNFRNDLSQQLEEIYPQVTVMEKFDREAFSLDRMNYSDAWDVGYTAGAAIEDSLTNTTTPDFGFDPEDVYQSVDPTMVGGPAQETADNTAEIASNTSKSTEDLKWLREIAEQEHIDKYTTAEIVVNFTSNANVTSTQDADDVFGEFSERLREAMEISRAG